MVPGNVPCYNYSLVMFLPFIFHHSKTTPSNTVLEQYHSERYTTLLLSFSNKQPHLPQYEAYFKTPHPLFPDLEIPQPIPLKTNPTPTSVEQQQPLLQQLLLQIN